MDNTKTYHCFNEKGSLTFPDTDAIIECKNRGLDIVLFLDNSICIEMMGYVKYGKKSKADKEKLIHYLEYIHRNDVEPLALLGLLELSHDRDTLKFDSKKLLDVKNRIDFLHSFPLKFVKSFQFNYEQNYKVSNHPSLPTESIEVLSPYLLTSYCCLLKIRELSLNGLDKPRAIRNIENYLDWSVNDLGAIKGLEFQLAKNVFGGNTKFRPMIWADGKVELTKKKLWGSAWDLFHSRISCNSLEASKFLGRNVRTYFVTNDFPLFSLMSQLSLEAIFSLSKTETRVHSVSGNYPLYDQQFIDDLSQRMRVYLRDRFDDEKIYNKEKIVSLIRELEFKNKLPKI